MSHIIDVIETNPFRLQRPLSIKNLMLKPSRETLRLQRERDKVEKELQDFTYSHPKWNEYDHETNLQDVELTLNEPLSKKEKMLKEIQIMRTGN